MTNIKNIAIIAHVDHGKTTLVDKIMFHCNLFRSNENTGDLILDNNDLERERGITITSKNVSVTYKDTKINIIDTPGHADFGGEVERVLNMADGVLLLVDAFEGPMPQTRFVLQKAINLGLKPCVVINKVDKQNCTPDEVHEAVFDLMFELGAEEWQLDFPTVYGSALNGWMSDDWQKPTESLAPLLDMVLEHIPSPKVTGGTLQMLITSLDFSSFVGRIAIGRLQRGILKENMQVTLIKRDGRKLKSRIKELYTFEGLGRKKVSEVMAGDICAIVGLEQFEIGDTIADFEQPEALTSIAIDEPTMSMLFTINDSPFFGKEGKFVTSRHLKERLEKELEKNLALRVEPTDSADKFIVFGRGVLHLSVLIETMRREGFEMGISRPEVIFREIDGEMQEPYENLTVDVPEESQGTIMEKLGERKAEMQDMVPDGHGRVRIDFIIPSRGLIGFRTEFMTATQGNGLIFSSFSHYGPKFSGTLGERNNGVLISIGQGKALAFALFNLQERGRLFIGHGEEVYEGMIIGLHSRANDLTV
ncbi:MAG: translational GTPase TypA, partial [Flavobacteriaceae bacterium]|nr:translational GTPase TypA [Flavobacteriaceae bacterium]